MVPLSVLDLVPVSDGSSATDALAHSTRLVQRAEELGFTRYWVAEHHAMPGIASSSPPVLIAHLAGATERIRVGSGGVMLPNHRPLVVAEQFGTLEALHPDRIDLGLGRAPGTDPATAAALRGIDAAQLNAPDDFPDQLVELASYFRGDADVLAVPAKGNAPSLWLLGSSGYSAKVAGMLGLPFAFAHHFSARNTMPALELYREHFRPSAMLSEPYSMIAASVFCAPTGDAARELALPSALQFLHLRLGDPRELPGPEEVAAFEWTDAARAFVEQRQADQIIGDPATVRAGVEELVSRTGVDELMVTTATYRGEDRLRSYELLADAVGVPGATTAA
ncbi:FMN-linked alkanal monooxygenase [Pseudonocardia sp. EC080610-09]|uniref:LLM class flavin-dependent oxidoreductase n=1 Tax=unclassified Pseudonocardia TaxID=2619320 RepID=UPI000524F227|nr:MULTISPECIES: LLM class flavin-dependent oxidoreductase [unclassified Pseudonocardia]ALE73170.1 FMN-linked alkanal monooxygenase [Pseudonocardia sp. EC080625-04]ALL76497.1 FMN-linked alkanal monooxygenase [Pseudonocardia sp. EC080610-09]ALL83522.1 FMN-linked alkanal monooxygenase [Pseudonocardia sp. EC080619-01]OLM19181.1 Luciferase-like monooxygenase [Pseudonocardia sp. Ae707_Ps1]